MHLICCWGVGKLCRAPCALQKVKEGISTCYWVVIAKHQGESYPTHMHSEHAVPQEEHNSPFPHWLQRFSDPSHQPFLDQLLASSVFIYIRNTQCPGSWFFLSRAILYGELGLMKQMQVPHCIIKPVLYAYLNSTFSNVMFVCDLNTN